MKIKKLHDNAKIPTFGSEGAACFDLYCVEDVTLPARVPTMIPTGLAFEVPKGYCMNVYLRSSMGCKGIIGNTGVVDSDYRGEVFVICTNVTMNTIHFKAGDRIAQARLEKLEPVTLEFAERLSNTKRGTGGCGSTGK